jgi:hypothetical protein
MMKTMRVLRCILAMMAVVWAISCDKAGVEPIGGGKKIGLSTYEISDNGKRGTYTVNTENKGWGDLVYRHYCKWRYHRVQ